MNRDKGSKDACSENIISFNLKIKCNTLIQSLKYKGLTTQHKKNAENSKGMRWLTIEGIITILNKRNLSKRLKI